MNTELDKDDIFATIAVHDSAISVSKVGNLCIINRKQVPNPSHCEHHPAASGSPGLTSIRDELLKLIPY